MRQFANVHKCPDVWVEENGSGSVSSQSREAAVLDGLSADEDPLFNSAIFSPINAFASKRWEALASQVHRSVLIQVINIQVVNK